MGYLLEARATALDHSICYIASPLPPPSAPLGRPMQSVSSPRPRTDGWTNEQGGDARNNLFHCQAYVHRGIICFIAFLIVGRRREQQLCPTALSSSTTKRNFRCCHVAKSITCVLVVTSSSIVSSTWNSSTSSAIRSSGSRHSVVIQRTQHVSTL